MYSFNPVASVPVDHTGFGIILAFAGIVLLMAICTEGFRYAAVISVPLALVVLLAYCVSYVWTNQTPKTFKNEKVVGEFVGYESEGYKERSGKSYVDRHYTYIVYKVDGGNVMLPCSTGVSYPERVTLYKN